MTVTRYHWERIFAYQPCGHYKYYQNRDTNDVNTWVVSERGTGQGAKGRRRSYPIVVLLIRLFLDFLLDYQYIALGSLLD